VSGLMQSMTGSTESLLRMAGSMTEAVEAGQGLTVTQPGSLEGVGTVKVGGVLSTEAGLGVTRTGSIMVEAGMTADQSAVTALEAIQTLLGGGPRSVEGQGSLTRTDPTSMEAIGSVSVSLSSHTEAMLTVYGAGAASIEAGHPIAMVVATSGESLQGRNADQGASTETVLSVALTHHVLSTEAGTMLYGARPVSLEAGHGLVGITLTSAEAVLSLGQVGQSAVEAGGSVSVTITHSMEGLSSPRALMVSALDALTGVLAMHPTSVEHGGLLAPVSHRSAVENFTAHLVFDYVEAEVWMPVAVSEPVVVFTVTLGDTVGYSAN